MTAGSVKLCLQKSSEYALYLQSILRNSFHTIEILDYAISNTVEGLEHILALYEKGPLEINWIDINNWANFQSFNFRQSGTIGRISLFQTNSSKINALHLPSNQNKLLDCLF